MDSVARPRRLNRFLLPIACFGLLLILLGTGLTLNPREVPSPLVGKPAPAFELPQLHQSESSFSPRQLLGQVWLLNVWASWCVSCREEHPILLDLARRNVVPIYGLNYKDPREDALRWLERFGDPYNVSVHDRQGAVGLDYGVYGVPETYVIDKKGVIRFKHIGVITPEILDRKILPLIGALKRDA